MVALQVGSQASVDKKYTDPTAPREATEGSRVNGKDWKIKKDAFRLGPASTNKLKGWEKRRQQDLEEKQYKARLQSLTQEKEDERRAHIEKIKSRREAKAEKERYQALAQKMHARKVDRLRKREKRNKKLKER